ncbi:MAG: hypothetical protein LLG09_02575 [Negativicutes bacterium]|nr:hypothetical protein [Negativicutes bacterium]
MNPEEMQNCMQKWQGILRLQDWDLHFLPVEVEWRKTGDIKIDDANHNAVLMLNVCNPKRSNTEEVIIHELLHLKLWQMDQMIEGLINLVYGTDEADSKREFAYTQFMLALESTVEDLAKSFTYLAAEEKESALGRLHQEIINEIQTDHYQIKQ